MSFMKFLVPVTGGARDASALATAFAAAKPFGGHVVALFVHADPREAIPFGELPLSPDFVQELIDTAADVERAATDAAFSSLERLENALRGSGEVGRGGRRVFLMDDLGLGIGLGQGLLERLDAVAAEGIVLGQGRDRDLALQRCRARYRILGRSARGAEDVPVPFVARDRIGDRRLDHEYFLVFLRHRQHGQGDAGIDRTDRDIHLVVAVGGGKLRLAHVRFVLGVLVVAYSSPISKPMLDCLA